MFVIYVLRQFTSKFSDDEDELSGPEGRYDKSNPIRGLQQISKGFEKWALRYIADCKLQPGRQQQRAQKWQGQILEALASNMEE